MLGNAVNIAAAEQDLAGFLLSQQLGYSVAMLLGAACSLCALVIYAFIYARLQRLAPHLANAE